MNAPQITQPSMYCRQCGYQLQGLSENRCPECGQAFDPGDSHTFRRNPQGWLVRRWLWRAAIAVLCLPLCVATDMLVLYWGSRAEQPARAIIQQRHGTFTYRYVGPDWLARLHSEIDWEWLPSVRPFDTVGTRIKGVDLSATRPWLRQLPGANRLDGASSIEADLAILKNLRWLRAVNLAYTGFSDGAIDHLRGLDLEDLDLQQTAITDKGLSHLAGMTSLRHLNLSGQGSRMPGWPTCRVLRSCRTWISPRPPSRKRASSGSGTHCP